MNRYTLDDVAERDLEAIHRHIACDNPEAAARFLRSFASKFELLASQPLMGQLVPELAPQLRSFVHGSYVVYYRPAHLGIEVARIIHASRDIDQAFNEAP